MRPSLHEGKNRTFVLAPPTLPTKFVALPFGFERVSGLQYTTSDSYYLDIMLLLCIDGPVTFRSVSRPCLTLGWTFLNELAYPTRCYP